MRPCISVGRILHANASVVRALCLAAVCCGLVVSRLAAQQPVQRDTQALLLASQSVTAMTGTTAITDATVSATVSYTAGSDQETGTATLLAKGTLESSVSLSLSGGSRLEVRNSTGMPSGAGLPAGQWSGPDSVVHAEAMHNCWTDPAWFFPALGVLSAVATDTTVSAVYVGAETHNGVSTQHLRFVRVLANADATVKTLSTEDLYLDPVTSLPLALDFNTHPDNDFGKNIAVEILFSNYQRLGTGLLPFHVQRYFNGPLMTDLTITSITLNSGLPDSNFTITASSN